MGDRGGGEGCLGLSRVRNILPGGIGKGELGCGVIRRQIHVPTLGCPVPGGTGVSAFELLLLVLGVFGFLDASSGEVALVSFGFGWGSVIGGVASSASADEELLFLPRPRPRPRPRPLLPLELLSPSPCER